MTQFRSIALCVCILSSGAAGLDWARAGVDPATVLIVVNDSTPPEPGTGYKGASQYVADHYAAARGIPLGNIVHIRTIMACCQNDPKAWDSWHISWQEFVDNVRAPIRAFLKEKRLERKIRYIVPTYGVPSHIANNPYGGVGVNGLSVDSFLAVMNSKYPDSCFVTNPIYRAGATGSPGVRFSASGTAYYFVARLDGPSAQIAAGLVDKALLAERGISRRSGTGYFDWRHLSPEAGGYYAGDQTMIGAYNACVAAGMRCNLNDQSVTGRMVAAASDSLWAWGWYSGATVNDVYAFAPGAVGAQLTSYTAYSLRSMVAGAWAPHWLARGITATWGATGEPYVSGYATGDILLKSLWNRCTFGEAAYLACPRLGWKMVFVGDPLYSPHFID